MMPINKKLFPNQQDRFMRYLLQFLWVVYCLIEGTLLNVYKVLMGKRKNRIVLCFT